MSLTEESRTVLKLVRARGKSYAEIAALLGIDEAAARDRAHVALTELSSPELPPLDPAACDFLLGRSDGLDTAEVQRRLDEDHALADQVEGIEEQLQLIAPGSTRGGSRSGGRTPGRRRPANRGTGAGSPSGPPDTTVPQERVSAPVSPPPVAGGGISSGRDGSVGRPSGGALSGQLTAAQRRLVAVLLGAALLAAILILILTGVIGGGSGSDPTESDNPAPTTATLRAVKGESGEGTAQIGFNSEGALAANLQVSDLKPSGKNETYALWFYGSKGAFPVNQSIVDKTGAIAGQIPLNEAVICLIAGDVFPEMRLSRLSRGEMNRALKQARRANGGNGKIPDYVGRTVLTGQISMPQEAKDRILPACNGTAPETAG